MFPQVALVPHMTHILYFRTSMKHCNNIWTTSGILQFYKVILTYSQWQYTNVLHWPHMRAGGRHVSSAVLYYMGYFEPGE